MLEKLTCTVSACKVMSSGLVADSSPTVFRSWLVALLKPNGSPLKAIKKSDVAHLVGQAIQFSSSLVPFPGVDTAGAVMFALLGSFKGHEIYMAFARVTTFAVVAEELGGLDAVVGIAFLDSRFAATSWWALSPNYQKRRDRLLTFLGETKSSPSREPKLLSWPSRFCPVSCIQSRTTVPYRRLSKVAMSANSLDITLASIAFDLSVDEIQGLKYFTLDSSSSDASVGRFETKHEADSVSPQLAGRLSALSMSSFFGASNEGGGSQVNAASFH